MLFWLICPSSSVEEQRPSKAKVTGSTPVSGTIFGSLAQLVRALGRHPRGH